MRRIMKKMLPMMILAGLVMVCVSVSTVMTSCSSSQETMYQRKQTNKASTVKSNIKVKGNNKRNGHTTRSY